MPSDHAPDVSVIITTYNRRDVLARAVACVLHQTHPDFELLVVDNGSTDDTASMMAQIRDPRVRYLRHPEPSHSCDAPRNYGIQHARGSFIAFLDDDDLWYPERLAKVTQAFAAHPEASAVCHHEQRRINGIIDRTLRHGPWSDEFFEALLYEGNRLSPCAMTIRADLLRRLGGFRLKPEFDGAADYDLWLRMASENTRIVFLEEPLGEFTVTGTNWSLTDPSFEAKVVRIVTEHLLAYEGKPLSQLSARGMRRLCQLHFLAARSFWAGRRYGQAATHAGYVLGFLIRRPSLIVWAGAKRWRHSQSAVAVSGVS